MLAGGRWNGADAIEAAIDAGAAGYVLKTASCEELLRSIRTVRNGQFFMSPGAASSFVQAYRSRPAVGENSMQTVLSAREREVLQLLALQLLLPQRLLLPLLQRLERPVLFLLSGPQ